MCVRYPFAGYLLSRSDVHRPNDSQPCPPLGCGNLAKVLEIPDFLGGGNSNMFLKFIPIWGNDPSWLGIFRWVETAYRALYWGRGSFPNKKHLILVVGEVIVSKPHGPILSFTQMSQKKYDYSICLYDIYAYNLWHAWLIYVRIKWERWCFPLFL